MGVNKKVMENHYFQDKRCLNFNEVVPGCEFYILYKSSDFLDSSKIAKNNHFLDPF